MLNEEDAHFSPGVKGKHDVGEPIAVSYLEHMSTVE